MVIKDPQLDRDVILCKNKFKVFSRGFFFQMVPFKAISNGDYYSTNTKWQLLFCQHQALENTHDPLVLNQ